MTPQQEVRFWSVVFVLAVVSIIAIMTTIGHFR